MRAIIHSINVSKGGVPKLPVAQAAIHVNGLEGDRQQHTKFHGGPTRAVSLLGLDVIESLQRQGHPIAPGATGENLTIAGVDWHTVGIGTTFEFEGGVVLEALSFARPCPAIRRAFLRDEIALLDADQHPGQARVYASVRTPGTVRTGEALLIAPPEVREPA